MFYFYSHNPRSQGCANLCQAIGARRIRHDNSRFRGSPDKVVINWGSSTLPDEIKKCRVINTAAAVDVCSDKFKFFMAVQGQCNIPDFTDKKKVAMEWADDKNKLVFCRTISRGSGGRGIVTAQDSKGVVDAPLYTLYIPKKDEWRIHMVNGEPFIIQRKAVSPDVPKDSVNWQIRNHDNGFIFSRNGDKKVPDAVIAEARRAFLAIKGLTFGSVDVIYNEHRAQAYVLEINTASGLEGTTLDDYAAMFDKLV